MLDIKIIPTSSVYYSKDTLELNIYGYSDRSLTLDLTLESGSVNRLLSLDLEKNKITKVTLEIDNSCKTKICNIKLLSDGKLLDSANYISLPEKDNLERKVAFVWHNHQAPGKYPDGTYKYIWGIVHTVENTLHSYGRGPYHYHTVILDKYNNYKATFNLSPSLLEQWNILIENGIIHKNGYISKDSLEAKIVSETLDRYKASFDRGQIDILTSIYAHTIMGFLIEKGFEDILIKELEYGIDITKKTFKRDPKGIWTPEMAFNMKLVKIYEDHGLEYTILDTNCHLRHKLSNLKPYIIKYQNSEVIVFFRDTELSNIISFRNNFYSELEAIKEASNLAYLISNKLINGGILTIALDGENWMIFSKNPPLTALYYDSLVNTLMKLQKKGYLNTAHLREIVDRVTYLESLENIPTTSWLCSWDKWCNEHEEQKIYWNRVYNILKRYLRIVASLNDEEKGEVEDALGHALDSDYWWSDFLDIDMIRKWLTHAENIIRKYN